MNIPNIPVAKLIDDNGNLNEIWHNFFFQLLQLMQQNLSDEGFLIPQLSTTDIAKLTDPSKTPNGTMVYDSTTDDFKGMKGGVFKTFTLT